MLPSLPQHATVNLLLKRHMILARVDLFLVALIRRYQLLFEFPRPE